MYLCSPFDHTLFITAPGPVVGVAIMVLNSTSVLVSWATPTDQNGVILHYNISIIAENNPLLTEPISERVLETDEGTYSITFVNLASFTSYRVTIFASTRIGPGMVVIRVIDTDPASASPPTNFLAEVLNSTAIMLTWGYPSTPRGNITGYIVTLDTAMLPTMNAATFNLTLDLAGDSQPQSLLVDELLPFTEYYFTVRAYSFGADPFFIHLGEESMQMETTREAGNVCSLAQSIFK